MGKSGSQRAPDSDTAPMIESDRGDDRRAVPFCSAYQSCGGCRTQHVPAAMRIDRALQRVRGALKRGQAGGLGLALQSPPPGAEKRSRVVLRVHGEGKALSSGLPAREQGIVAMDSCPATSERAIAVAKATVAAARAHQVPGLCAIAVHASGDGERVLVTLVADSSRVAHAQDLGRAAQAAGATHIAVNQTESQKRVLGRRSVPIAGAFPFVEVISGMRLRVPPSSPFEPTHWSAATLAADLVAVAGELAERKALVLRAGNGLTALALARAGATVAAIEDRPEIAHEAEGSGIDNGFGDAIAWSTEHHVEALAKLSGSRPDLVVVDAPNAGTDLARLAAIARLIAPPRIVLVARSTDALSRDLAGLADLGYRANAVRAHESDALSGDATVLVALVR